ncbi:MAG: ABC transporter ATP-binding protein [Armatimonadota bacterium]
MSSILQFTDLSYTMGESRRLCVSGEATSGEILQITGPSGCGKSTLLRLLARLIPRETGQITLLDQPDTAINPLIWRTKVHYFAQKPIMTEGSVWQNINYPFTLKIRADQPKPHIALATTYLNLMGLPDGLLEQSAASLSWGEKQRVALVRSLLMEPVVLLLDEPTASLDDSSRSAMMTLVAEWLSERDGRSVVLVSHNSEPLAGVPLRALSLG